MRYPIPRPGTRRRAVYDALKNAGGNSLRRRDLWNIYWQVEPHARSQLGLSTALNMYAKRTRHGMYAAQDWVLGVEKPVPAAQPYVLWSYPAAEAPALPVGEAIQKDDVEKGTALPDAELPPPAPQPEPPPAAAEPVPRNGERLIPGDLAKFTSPTGEGHFDAVFGHTYRIIKVEKPADGDPLARGVDTDGSEREIECYVTRFELVDPATVPPKVEARFVKGEKVAYKGGYPYLDELGTAVGTVFTVKGYGERGEEREDGRFLYLEELPGAGHHPDHFRRWPAPDDEIKCQCGAVSWGPARNHNPWAHLVETWTAGYRKYAPHEEAGVHFLDRPCRLDNGKVAFKNTAVFGALNQIDVVKLKVAAIIAQAKGIDQAMDDLKKWLEGGERLHPVKLNK